MAACGVLSLVPPLEIAEMSPTSTPRAEILLHYNVTRFNVPCNLFSRRKRPTTSAMREKTRNRCQARENMQLVPRAGKHGTGAKRGKTCNRCQLRGKTSCETGHTKIARKIESDTDRYFNQRTWVMRLQ